MPQYHMPDCIDIANAPERASLGILSAVLLVVESALYAEHPTLLHDDFILACWPDSLSLAYRIIDSCNKLQHLIDRYEHAVKDAVGNHSDPLPF